jgi:phytoene dehydrogenase-like protein
MEECSARNVVVVGGGIAGLTAAAELARGSARVVLVEAGKALGGRAQTREVEGFSLNLGAHALYEAGAATRVLAGLGVALQGREPARRGGVLVRGDAHLPLPSSMLGLLMMAGLGFGERLAFGGVLAHARRTRTPQESSKSFAAWLDARGGSARLRAVVCAMARLSTYTADLDLIDAASVLDQLAMAAKGVRYVDGGWQRLCTGLAEKARGFGAVLQTGVAARRVHADGSVRGVELGDGRMLAADAVVLALAPRRLAQLLPDDAECAADAARLVPARAACFDVGLRALGGPTKFALDMAVPHYYSLHSETARLAPPGMHLIHTARYLRRHEKLSADALRSDLEGWLARFQPGYAEQVAALQFFPSLTVTEGLPMAERGGRAGRPRTRHGKIRGLFRAGDWVGSEGLLSDAAFASAAHASREALGYLRELANGQSARDHAA